MKDHLLNNFFRLYGHTVGTNDGSCAVWKAFVTPTGKSDNGIPTRLGWKNSRELIYIGPPDRKPEGEMIVRGCVYRVSGCMPVYLGDEVDHYRATLIKIGGEDSNG